MGVRGYGGCLYMFTPPSERGRKIGGGKTATRKAPGGTVSSDRAQFSVISCSIRAQSRKWTGGQFWSGTIPGDIPSAPRRQGE